MKSKLRTRLSRVLLAATLALGVTSSIAMSTGPGPQPPPNQCVYCFHVMGMVWCITTTTPIPGGDIGACRF
jgi:hypothetical protein